jgi:lipoprotein-anchoring transpeptidase ErfK/SrfK
VSGTKAPVAFIGNEFVKAPPRLTVNPEPLPLLNHTVLAAPVAGSFGLPARRLDFTPPDELMRRLHSPWRRLLDGAHRYSLATFAVLILLVGGSGIELLARDYFSYQTLPIAAATAAASRATTGLNITVPNYELQTKLQAIAGQPATLSVAGQNLSLSYDTIKNWLRITPSADRTIYSLHVDPAAIAASLKNVAGQYVTKPVDQVVDGSTVVSPGTDGTALADPASLDAQADSIAKNLLAGGGLKVAVGLKSLPFQSVGLASFDQLIEINLTSQMLNTYQAGQLVNSFPVTTGGRLTPTPLGQFSIWQKLASANAVSYSSNGKYHYTTPVQSLNYFDHSGDAITADDGQPASVPGHANPLHGSVSLSADQATWLYGWATTGTTVIIHS